MKKQYLWAIIVTISLFCVFSKNITGFCEQLSECNISKIPDGEYIGAAKEYGGAVIKVKVIVEDHMIKNIEIIESKEDGYVFIASGLIPLILELQSLDVEAVTGATDSSQALKRAIKNALLEK